MASLWVKNNIIDESNGNILFNTYPVFLFVFLLINMFLLFILVEYTRAAWHQCSNPFKQPNVWGASEPDFVHHPWHS